ncbi:MAG: hypothetical protein Q9198_008634, partial [Flavoplaca austrocitrina]
MDEREHDLISTAARVESVGTDLPAKSDLLKSKVERSGKDLPPTAPTKGRLSSLFVRSPRPQRQSITQSKQGSPSKLHSEYTKGKSTGHHSPWKSDLPLSKDRTLEPALPSKLLSTNAEDLSTEYDLLIKSAPSQPGSKPYERASHSKSSSPRTSIYPLDSLMSIIVWSADGVAHEVETKQNATVSELKQHIQAKTGIQPDHMKLRHDNRILGGRYGASSEEDYLSNYGIRDKHHMDVRDTRSKIYSSGPKPEPDTRNHQAQHQAEATSTDYDKDLYIADPQSYFDELGRLERDVVQHSEYFRMKREYNLSSAVNPADNDGDFLRDLSLPASLQRKIRRSSIVAQ